MPISKKQLIQINKPFVEIYKSFPERSQERIRFRNMILAKTGINYETLRGSINRNNFSNANQRLIALAMSNNAAKIEIEKTIKILFP